MQTGRERRVDLNPAWRLPVGETVSLLACHMLRCVEEVKSPGCRSHRQPVLVRHPRSLAGETCQASCEPPSPNPSLTLADSGVSSLFLTHVDGHLGPRGSALSVFSALVQLVLGVGRAQSPVNIHGAKAH